MVRHRSQDDFPLSTQIRYTKKNWMTNETREPIMGTSNGDRWPEERRHMLPKPETNQW